MQNLIIRTEELEAQGILVKNAKSFMYKGNFFKEGVSFSQHHRQLAVDMLKQELANGEPCILVENDHILTFYHQQASSNGPKVFPHIVQQSRQNPSRRRLEIFSREHGEAVSQTPLIPKQDQPTLGDRPLYSSTTHHSTTMPDAPEYKMDMSFDSSTWLNRLVNQISKAQDLQTIFDTAVADLRPFLAIDRVIICQFQSEDRVHVIAEANHNNRLPSLLSLPVPTDDISPYSQSKLSELRTGAMIDLVRRTICQIKSPNWNLKSTQLETSKYLPVDSRQIQSLTNMGVKFSLIMPIFYHETTWGLLVAHHSEVHFISTRRFEVLQMAVDQLSIAVAQQALHIQSQTKAEQDAVLNRIVSLLQTSSTADFKLALETAVTAFQGSGGRLCMSNPTRNLQDGAAKNFTACLAASSPSVKVYACGVQPAILADNPRLMEQYRLWQDRYQSSHYQVWPISNLYQTSELQPLFEAFRLTSIEGLLMIPLVYRQQLLGYLSIFRSSIAANSSQTKQSGAEQTAPVQEWSNLDFAQKLGQQFAMAIYEHELSQQHQITQRLHHSNSHLNTELQQHTAQLQQVAQQQQGLSQILAKVKAAIDPETIFLTTTKELCLLLKAERVSVYRFKPDWGGEFVHDFEYVVPTWMRSSKLGRNTAWNDTYLQETRGGRYRHNETFAADDIYQANLSPCHIEILEQFHIKAFATAPVFVGKSLWGVLAAYQHSQTRQWLTTDILFLSQTATALGLALQQAELLAHNQDIIKPYNNSSKEFNLDSRSLPSG